MRSNADWVDRLLMLGVVGLAGVVWIAWYTSPRGFDLLDSGCYYLEYAFPKDSADTHTSYRFFASPLYYLCGESIVAFRWVSWFFVWGAAAVFAWGFYRHLKTIRPDATAALTLVVILGLFIHGSSAMYTIKPAALTYNSLNLVGMFVGLGLFLAGSATLMGTEPRLRAGLVQVAAGVAVASLDFFIKPTTSAFLVAAFFTLLLVNGAIPRSTKKTIAAVTSGAAVLGAVLAMILLGGPSALAIRFGTLVGILENHAYMDVLLTRVAREFGELFAFLCGDLKWAAPALGLTFVLGGLMRRSQAQGVLLITGTFVTLGLWFWRLAEAKLWRGSHQLYVEGVVARSYLGILVLSVIGILGAWCLDRNVRPPDERRRRRLIGLLAAFLAVTPFAGAFGTTTSIYLNGALYASCWLAVTILALVEICRAFNVRWLLPAVLLPMVALSIAQLVHGQIVMPYMNPKPLWEQTEKTEFGVQGSSLKLDPALHNFIEDARMILEDHGFKRGDDIFCFFNIPGLVYAVGGRSPIIPWYFGRIYVDDRVEEWHLRQASEERRRNAWVITQADALRFRESYLRGGVDFPDGYERIGTLTNPVTQMEVGLWKPKTRP